MISGKGKWKNIPWCTLRNLKVSLDHHHACHFQLYLLHQQKIRLSTFQTPKQQLPPPWPSVPKPPLPTKTIQTISVSELAHWHSHMYQQYSHQPPAALLLPAPHPSSSSFLHNGLVLFSLIPVPLPQPTVECYLWLILTKYIRKKHIWRLTHLSLCFTLLSFPFLLTRSFSNIVIILRDLFITFNMGLCFRIKI